MDVKSIVQFLTGFAVLIALLNLYLKVNKIWKRKHEKEVAESLSIVALSNEAILYVLWSTSFVLSRDWNAFADNAIALIECSFYIIIGTGIFVAQKRVSRKSFWQMAKESFKLERKEAAYLWKAMSGQNQAAKILSMLQKLAWIDDEFDKKEIQLVKNFAQIWNIKLNEADFLSNPHLSNVEFSTRFESIKNDLESFLKENPPKAQAKELSELFNKLIAADGKIDINEDIIIGELDGLILRYLGKPITVYKVIVIPQDEAQCKYIESIIDELEPKSNTSRRISIDGGFGYLVVQCFSKNYADYRACREREAHKLMTTIKEEQLSS